MTNTMFLDEYTSWLAVTLPLYNKTYLRSGTESLYVLTQLPFIIAISGYIGILPIILFQHTKYQGTIESYRGYLILAEWSK